MVFQHKQSSLSKNYLATRYIRCRVLIGFTPTSYLDDVNEMTGIVA